MKKRNKAVLFGVLLILAAALTFTFAGCQKERALIVFQSNGGSYVAPIEAEVGSVLGNFTVPRKEGYLFQGWFLDAECKKSAQGEELKGDTVLYAKWYAQEITVTLDSGEAQLGSVQMKARAGESFTLPAEIPSFEYKGYFLKNWGYDKLGHFTYEKGESVKLNKDTVFYALWEKKQLSVIFHGSDLPSLTLPAFSVLYAPEAPQKKGYVFGGWYLDPEFQTPYEFGSEITENVDLYCKWDALFTFDFLDGMTAVTGLSEIGKNYLTQNGGVITVPEDYNGNAVLKIADNAFSGVCALTSIALPDSLLEIGSNAFFGCASLSSVSGAAEGKFPLSLNWIGASAFYNTALYVVDLGENVLSIGYEAFASCAQLKEVKLSEKLDRLGSLAFSLSPVESYIISDANEKFCAVNGDLYSKDKKTLILYAIGKNQTSYTTAAEVESIAPYAFYGASKLVSITLSGAVNSIGMFALSDCMLLENLVIENESAICRAEESALSGADALNSIRVSQTLLEQYLQDDFWKNYSALIGAI